MKNVKALSLVALLILGVGTLTACNKAPDMGTNEVRQVPEEAGSDNMRQGAYNEAIPDDATKIEKNAEQKADINKAKSDTAVDE